MGQCSSSPASWTGVGSLCFGRLTRRSLPLGKRGPDFGFGSRWTRIQLEPISSQISDVRLDRTSCRQIDWRHGLAQLDDAVGVVQSVVRIPYGGVARSWPETGILSWWRILCY